MRTCAAALEDLELDLLRDDQYSKKLRCRLISQVNQRCLEFNRQVKQEWQTTTRQQYGSSCQRRTNSRSVARFSWCSPPLGSGSKRGCDRALRRVILSSPLLSSRRLVPIVSAVHVHVQHTWQKNDRWARIMLQLASPSSSSPFCGFLSVKTAYLLKENPPKKFKFDMNWLGRTLGNCSSLFLRLQDQVLAVSNKLHLDEIYSHSSLVIQIQPFY